MKSFFLSALVLIFLLPCCFGQVKDFQTWTSATIKKSFSKKWSTALEQELRMKDNSTQLRQTFTDISITYKVKKNFEVTGDYRFIIKPEGEIDHRLHADAALSWKKKKIELTARIRIQHDFVADFNDDNYIRPRLLFNYEVEKKWTPYIAGELFYHALYYRGDKFDEYRFYAGITHDFNKRNSLKCFYLLQQQFNVNAARQNHILGISYSFDL